MIKTSCEKCIFSTFNQNGIQDGCTLGRISKYIDKGLANLVENHYVIDTYCNTCRSSDQFKLTEEQVREQVQIKVAIIINGIEGDYWRTLKSMLEQTITPKKVFVVVKEFNETDKYMEYIKWFSDAGSQLTIKKYFEEKQFLDCVDDIVKKFDRKWYYTTINYDSQLGYDYIQRINDQINENLNPVVCVIRNLNGDFPYYNTFSVQLHNTFAGNAFGQTLKSKILERLEQEKDKNTIWLESQLS